MICQQNKYIFIHIPKTAGTSIELALQVNKSDLGWVDKYKLWKQHRTIGQIKKFYIPDIEGYYKFSFVRNPWDRAVSDWKYFTYQECISFEGYRVELKSQTLKDYLLCTGGYEKYNHLHSPSGRGDHWALQYNFINIDGIDCMDFIGKFENLQEDFNKVCDKIGIPRQQLQHVNKTNHKHYTEYYDDETRAIVAEKYAKDIEYFGYKFGE